MATYLFLAAATLGFVTGNIALGSMALSLAVISFEKSQDDDQE